MKYRNTTHESTKPICIYKEGTACEKLVIPDMSHTYFRSECKQCLR